MAEESGHIYWLLNDRVVQLALPSCIVKCFTLRFKIKSGSRAVADGSLLYILENGTSKIWSLQIQNLSGRAKRVTSNQESKRFRSSLGSRFVKVEDGLLITGTPGRGAHTPWLYRFSTRKWKKLPDAPHPILSSAVMRVSGGVTISGGWSKQRSCHGHAQTLDIENGIWSASRSYTAWRRPGAGCLVNGNAFVAMGWMEHNGAIGSDTFRLLRRNGKSQNARTSSSKLCLLDQESGLMTEIAQMPFADSYEHSGEIFPVGNSKVLCIGRDRVQTFDLESGRWQTCPLPKQLRNDKSNSWVKHCGSWAMTWVPTITETTI